LEVIGQHPDGEGKGLEDSSNPQDGVCNGRAFGNLLDVLEGATEPEHCGNKERRREEEERGEEKKKKREEKSSRDQSRERGEGERERERDGEKTLDKEEENRVESSV